ncbi:MAG: hypothetical protein ANABAC_1788 [Anaerolineae bacterium]|nr:MAG: hypothetical protein ANABAC_1788 [Anaerolineae bacterium]
MRKIIVAFGLLSGIVLLLLACSTPASPPPSQEQDPLTAVATAVFTPTSTAATSEQIVELEPTQVAAAQDACVACHSDKQRITDTAKPEEDTESESKGVG